MVCVIGGGSRGIFQPLLKGWVTHICAKWNCFLSVTFSNALVRPPFWPVPKPQARKSQRYHRKRNFMRISWMFYQPFEVKWIMSFVSLDLWVSLNFFQSKLLDFWYCQQRFNISVKNFQAIYEPNRGRPNNSIKTYCDLSERPCLSLATRASMLGPSWVNIGNFYQMTELLSYSRLWDRQNLLTRGGRVNRDKTGVKLGVHYFFICHHPRAQSTNKNKNHLGPFSYLPKKNLNLHVPPSVFIERWLLQNCDL